MFRKNHYLHILLIAVLAVTAAACASMGRPEGGPRDYDPPVFLRSNPAPGQTDFSKNRLDLYFNENLKLEDVTNKVVVSPAQIQMPQITANGKRITVELKDSMLPNTTYTIDFSDAITDLNEGNVLDGFSMDFSTGSGIDSLRISGMVFQASNLEPAQGMLVGVYSNYTDTSLTALPMNRIAKTNQLGQFTIRGLSPGTYRIFAINDVNRDNHWNRSEDVAFYDLDITPTAHTINVTDTLANSWGEDSLVIRKATEFLPDDILLTWFNEGYAAEYLKNYKREDSTRIYIEFAAPSDTLPELTIASGKFAGKKIDRTNSRLDASLTNDTLTYWLTDPELVSSDTLSIATRYLKTDSTENLSWTTDTLLFTFRRQKPSKNKKESKEKADSVPPRKLITFSLVSPPKVDVYAPLRFRSSEPLEKFNPQGFTLEIKEDTLWYPVSIGEIVQDTLRKELDFRLPVKWQEGAAYRLTVDSMAVQGIYGGVNKKLTEEFSVKREDDYGAIFFTIKDVDADKMMIELLNPKDEVVRRVRVRNSMASFLYLEPGTYYARGFIDADGNGLWTTGEIASSRQPEEVFYYPKKITLKKNWDIEQTWNPFETMLDLQKPEDIKKNKPKKRGAEASSQQNGGENENDDDWDDFTNPGSQYNDAHRNRTGGMKRNNTTRL